MSSATVTSSSGSTSLSMNGSMSFSDQLNKLRVEFETNDDIRSARLQEAKVKATQYFLTTLLSAPDAQQQFESSAMSAAGLGKKLVQLTSWSGRGPVYSNTSLCELLDTGDLISRMQDWLDETYGADGFRVFHYPIRNSRTTALTVSWDKAGFDNADGIIRANRERAQQRSEHRSENRDQRGHVAEQDQDQEDEPPTKSHSDNGHRQRFNGQRGGYSQSGQRRYTGPSRAEEEPRIFTPRAASNGGDYHHRSRQTEERQDVRPRSESVRGARSGYQATRVEDDQRPRRRVNYD